MKLDERHRAWLVTQYACYKRNGEVLRDFTAKFGEVLPKNQAAHYDLSGILTHEQARAKGLGKWFKLFRDVRRRFEASISDIPIASRAYRIKKLDEMFELAYEKRNFRTAAQLLEQAAKESGNAFTNVRKVDGAIDHKHEVEHTIPEEVRDASLAESLRGAIEKALAASAAPPQTIQ